MSCSPEQSGLKHSAPSPSPEGERRAAKRRLITPVEAPIFTFDTINPSALSNAQAVASTPAAAYTYSSPPYTYQQLPAPTVQSSYTTSPRGMFQISPQANPTIAASPLLASAYQAAGSQLRISGFSLADAGLSLPVQVPGPELLRRQRAMMQEIAYQTNNPPILPASQIPDLPPKPVVEEFSKFPEGIDDQLRNGLEAKNNRIAAQHQKIDRQRNNMAAKKSRQSRLEDLANSRRLLNAKSVECAWFRMKVMSMGGSVSE